MNWPIDKFESYRLMLMGRARSLSYLGDGPTELDIEDVVSSAIAKAIKSADTFDGKTPGELGSWLLKIVESVFFDEWRRIIAQKRGRGRVKSLDDFLTESKSGLDRFLAADMSSVSAPLRQEELMQRVYVAIEQLPEQQREVLFRRFLRNQGLATIAASLEISEQAVSGKLNRALKTLREALQEIN